MANNTKNKKIIKSFKDLADQLLLSGTDTKKIHVEKPFSSDKIILNKRKDVKTKVRKQIPEKNVSRREFSSKRKLIRFNHESFYNKLNAAKDHTKHESHKEAILLFSEALEQGFKFIRDSRNEGVYKTEHGNLDGALKEYKEARKVFKKLISIFYNRGIARIKIKDYSEAMDDFVMVTKHQTEHKDAYLQIVQIKERLGDFDGAIHDLNIVIKMEPLNKKFYLKRAGFFIIKKDLENAVKDYKRSFSHDPKNPKNVLKYGIFLLKKGKIDAAIKEFDRVIIFLEKILKKVSTIDPALLKEPLMLIKKIDLPLIKLLLHRAEAKRRKGLMAACEKDYSRIIELEPLNEDVYIKRAEVRMIRHDVDGAIEDYEFILKRQQGNAALFLKRAHLLVLKQDYENAVSDYNTAIELEPFHVPVFVKRAEVRQKMNDLTGALEDYSRVIDFRPEDYKLYYKRAFIRKLLKNHEDFIKDMQTALNLDPDSPVKYHRQGEDNVLNHDLQQAIKNYSEAIDRTKDLVFTFFNSDEGSIDSFELTPVIISSLKDLGIDFISYYISRGQCYFLMNNHSQAIVDFSKILKVNANNEKILMERAIARFSKKDMKGAFRDFKKVIELNAKNDNAYSYRARIFAYKGDSESALKDFHRALKLNPNDASHNMHLGVFLFNQELFEGAVLSLNKAIQRDKHSYEAYHYLALIHVQEDSSYKDPKKALKFALKTLEIKTEPDYFETLANAYALNDNYQAAFDSQKKAYELSPAKDSKKQMEIFQSKLTS